MTRAEQEVLEFLRDFETSTRTYFLRKGIGDSELPTALLEAQWQLLRSIMQAKLPTRPRQQNYRRPIRRKVINSR